MFQGSGMFGVWGLGFSLGFGNVYGLGFKVSVWLGLAFEGDVGTESPLVHKDSLSLGYLRNYG